MGCSSKLSFCSKLFAVALSLMMLLCPHSSYSRRRWRRSPYLKLAEKDNDYEYPLQSHGTPYQKNDRCPPPPQMLPHRACEVPSCRSDSECERHKRCCYNGCIYACLESVPPPPVLDWLVQPKPRWLGGNGWLLDGPEEILQAEACSTTEDGDEPLRCPTGYECHIINPGNAAEGIPNRGQCIKLRGNADGWNLKTKNYKGYFVVPKTCSRKSHCPLEQDFKGHWNCRRRQVNYSDRCTKGSSSNNVVGYVKPKQKHLG